MTALIRSRLRLDRDADPLTHPGAHVGVKLAARLHDDHGLVIDREVAFLRLLVGGADAAAQRESLLRERRLRPPAGQASSA